MSLVPALHEVAIFLTGQRQVATATVISYRPPKAPWCPLTWRIYTHPPLTDLFIFLLLPAFYSASHPRAQRAAQRAPAD
jgi:hypothetical protein